MYLLHEEFPSVNLHPDDEMGDVGEDADGVLNRSTDCAVAFKSAEVLDWEHLVWN